MIPTESKEVDVISIVRAGTPFQIYQYLEGRKEKIVKAKITPPPPNIFFPRIRPTIFFVL